MKTVMLGFAFAVIGLAQFAPASTGALAATGGTCSTPSFSPGSGTYSGTQSVTLSSSCTTICYNASGSPSATVPGTCDMGSTTYSGAILVSSSETIYALGTQLLHANSSVGSAAYTITVGVSLSNHGARGYPISGCANGVTSCTIPITVAFTGDAIVAAARFCVNTSCSSNTGCSLSASDGTHTYTAFTAASVINLQATSVFYNIRLVSAVNAAAGSYTLTFSISGTSCTFYYLIETYYDFSGANTSAPIDTAVSKTATSGATQSSTSTVTSAGNVTNGNELAIAILSASNATITSMGSFSTLQAILPEAVDQDLIHPTGGAAITATASLSSSDNWWYSLFAITP
jgi:hypothetical protein